MPQNTLQLSPIEDAIAVIAMFHVDPVGMGAEVVEDVVIGDKTLVGLYEPDKGSGYTPPLARALRRRNFSVEVHRLVGEGYEIWAGWPEED